jgi:uncharacterized membrane protein
MLENKKLIYSLLAVSVAINFIFIGAAGSAAWRWSKVKNDSAWLERRLDQSQERFLRRLEGADLELAQQIFDKRRPLLSDAVSDLRAARSAFRRAITAETPDAAALTAAIARSQAAGQQLNENLHGAIRDMAQGLSVDARRKIAARMRHHRKDDD